MYLVLDEALRRERPAWSAWFDELVDLEGDGSWCGRAQAELGILVSADQVQIRGDVTASVPRECDLCLAHYLEPVEAELKEVCLVSATEDGGPAVWDEDADVWRVAGNGRIDITEMVRQAMLLALPTRALCSDACPGRELIEESRSATDAVDPRLAILKRLMNEDGEDDGGPEAKDE